MKKYYREKTEYSNAVYIIDNDDKIKIFYKFDDFLKACKYDLCDADLCNIPNNIKLSLYKKKIKYNQFTILPNYIWKQLGQVVPKLSNNSLYPNELIMETKEDNNKMLNIIVPYEATEIGEIYYISDLHLDSKLPKDVTILQASLLIKQLLCNIYENKKSIYSMYVFAGDISHNKILYKLFINILSEFSGKKIIVLGNHEFWDFKNIKEAKSFYKEYYNRKNMYFLYNELLCIPPEYPFDNKIVKITEKELLDLSEKEDKRLKKIFDHSQYFILGGCGFSGRNSNFNAKNGLYYKCIDYNSDKIETDKFDNIFNRVSSLVKNKSLLVISHTPYTNWHKGSLPNIDTNIYYISGHTHKNRYEKIYNNFIYADNQIGYTSNINNAKFRSLLFKADFDYFYDFQDGIKEIDYEEYLKFLKGKRIGTYAKPKNGFKLYLVRKDGYSMFIRESKTGNLCLMYKGQAKNLPKKPIKYFYDNIKYSIDRIKAPLKQFNDFLNSISNEVKSIGGNGNIHGQIIDIDYYNHLYINPSDKQITPYYATDEVNKIVYPTLGMLLKERVDDKSLYKNYKRMTTSNLLSIISCCKLPDIKKPMEYKSTNIYKTNNLFHKLNLNIYEKIIGFWVEPNKNFYKIANINNILLHNEMHDNKE